MKAAEQVTYWKMEIKNNDEFSRHGNINAVIGSLHLFAAYHGSIINTTIVAAWNIIWMIPIPITDTKIGKLINLPGGYSIVSFL